MKLTLKGKVRQTIILEIQVLRKVLETKHSVQTFTDTYMGKGYKIRNIFLMKNNN